jgi:hypothetical protein
MGGEYEEITCGYLPLLTKKLKGINKFAILKKMENILRIAIQTKGRLNEESEELIRECGIKLTVGKRQLLSPAKNSCFVSEDDALFINIR